jgi:hypothetical protein
MLYVRGLFHSRLSEAIAVEPNSARQSTTPQEVLGFVRDNSLESFMDRYPTPTAMDAGHE